MREARRKRWIRKHIWRWRWAHLDQGWRSWVVATGACESHNNPRTYTGNGYSGEGQWLPGTARAAGFKRLPHLVSIYEQRVRMAWFARSNGKGHWTCSAW